MQRMKAPELTGTPDATALVIVEIQGKSHGAFGIPTGLNVQRAVLVSDDGTRPTVVGRPVAGFVVFSGLPAGGYQLQVVEAVRKVGQATFRETFSVPATSAAHGTVRANPGEPNYLGIVTIDQRVGFREQGVTFDLKVDKAAEVAAWEKFVEIYKGSPWVEDVNKKIVALRR